MISDKFKNAVDLIDDSIIKEAIEFYDEKITSSEEDAVLPEAEPEKISVKKNTGYYIIPTAAACAALILTVNHFTSPKNSESPELNNSVITVTTVPDISEPVTPAVSSEILNTSVFSELTSKSAAQETSSKTAASHYAPVITSKDSISSTAPVTSVTSENSGTAVNITTAAESGTEEDVSEVVTKNESVNTPAFTSAVTIMVPATFPATAPVALATTINEIKDTDSSVECLPPVEPAIRPVYNTSPTSCDNPVTPDNDNIIYKYAYYSGKKYVFIMMSNLKAPIPSGEEVNILLTQYTALEEDEPVDEEKVVTAKAYIYDGIYRDDVLFMVSESSGTCTVYVNSEMSYTERNDVLKSIRSFV